MSIPTISTLPTPPTRADAANFASRADAFMAALPTFQSETNLAIGSMNAFQVRNSFRNRIINGDMQIDQRNAGASQTITAAAGYAYTVDRWYAYSSGANVTGQRVAGANAGMSRYRFTAATGTTAIGFGQRIESDNCADFAGTTATLSVDMANSSTTTVTWTAYYATTTNDTFGTRASPTRTQIATGTWSVTSTLTRFSAQISVPGAATTGIEIVFSVGTQANAQTWTIGDVQLEAGNISGGTPFERRHIGIEQALCQRYFYTIDIMPTYFVFTGGTALYQHFTLPITMRATPSVSTASMQYYSAGSATSFTPSFTNSNTGSVAVGSGSGLTNAQGLAGGTIKLDAEMTS